MANRKHRNVVVSIVLLFLFVLFISCEKTNATDDLSDADQQISESDSQLDSDSETEEEDLLADTETDIEVVDLSDDDNDSITDLETDLETETETADDVDGESSTENDPDESDEDDSVSDEDISQEVDIRFVQVSDTHYRVLAEENSANIAWVKKINGIEDLDLPSYMTGKVGKIRGVIHSGDIIDAGGDRAVQWDNFVKDFGLDGTDGTLKYPVYEGYGNHDQDSWLKEVATRIVARNAKRPGVTNSHAENPHYSWDWSGVHFVQVNIRVGSTTARYNPKESHQFLVDDLAKNVGNSGRPVVIMHHLHMGAGESDWPAAEKEEYYNAIKDYNVIAILWGHTHAYGVGEWNKITTVNVQSLAKGYVFFHITATEMNITPREKGDTWGKTVTLPISFKK